VVLQVLLAGGGGLELDVLDAAIGVRVDLVDVPKVESRARGERERREKDSGEDAHDNLRNAGNHRR
jgi:hypothetical protein